MNTKIIEKNINNKDFKCRFHRSATEHNQYFWIRYYGDSTHCAKFVHQCKNFEFLEYPLMHFPVLPKLIIVDCRLKFLRMKISLI